METVKVDIQKLQLLNDRINQTIEALSQLRQSVHGYQTTLGIQHSMPTIPVQGAYPFAANVAGAPVVAPLGLSHTMPGVTPALAYGLGYNVAAQPYGIAQSFVPGALGFWGAPTGLSHTSYAPRFELSRLDPMSAMWLTQAFPYAFSPVPVI